MTELVSRTCSEIRESTEPGSPDPPAKTRSLEYFREEPAYVLLGDPGAGKTTAFHRECSALGNDALSVAPRDLIDFEVANHPEWRGKTLFIDGLDEVRAGAPDARTPLGSIRQKLDALGRPRFRISCRQADWLGTNDLQNLGTVAPGGKLILLQLDPLTQHDVVTILVSSPDIEDPESFVREAEQRKIDGLLFNPNNLKLLMAAVADGAWPESRLQTFEIACAKLVEEQNRDHAVAAPRLARERLLAAAGRLSAVSLLSGTAGFALYESAGDSDFLELSQSRSDDLEACRQAVTTRLFTAVGEARFAFVHRHIAEFLGARYLAGIVEAGLPLRRVLALITGPDGTVVTTMRGLSAWLAAHCPRSRHELIERDPVGVGLYGDLSTFTCEQKRALLQSLTKVAPQALSVREAAAFAPLVVPQMESTFRDVLNDPDRRERQQHLVLFLLQVMREGVPLARLAPVCLDIVRDETREPSIGAAALDAFIRCCDGSDRPAVLRDLLTDIAARRVSDPGLEKLGTILAVLYPEHLRPNEIWEYLFDRHQRSRLFIGSYYSFWDFELLQNSSDRNVCELLEACRVNVKPVRRSLDSQSLNDVLPTLVSRGLKFCGDRLDTSRLYDWLGIGLPEEGIANDSDAIEDVRDWLSERPDTIKAVLLEGVLRSTDDEEFRVYTDRVVERLFGARLPDDFGVWCLDQAISLNETRPRAAEFLLLQACTIGGVDSVFAQQLVQDKPGLSAFFHRVFFGDQANVSATVEVREQDDRRLAIHQERAKEWQRALRTERVSLLDNCASPQRLHQLAARYFGSFLGFEHEKGTERVARLVGGDSELLDLVLSAIRGVVLREDVPDFDEVCEVHSRRQMHYLGLPYLAGLAIAENDSPLDVSQWSPEKRRKSAALYLTGCHADYEPGWYSDLLERHPDDVADAHVRLAAATLRDGRDAEYNLFRFARDQAQAEVARRASLPLLRIFPLRCRAAQLPTLDLLLRAALIHVDHKALEEAVALKLSKVGMNPLQKAHWLAAGCLVASKTYLNPMADFARAGRGDERIRHILMLFCSDSRLELPLDGLNVPTEKTLIQLGGASYGPEWLERSGIVRMTMQASRLIRRLIQRLAQNPSLDARDALQSLLADQNLSRWRNAIEAAINEQRVVWRDARYQVPSLDQVLETLSDRNPSNAADLAALVTELLRAIGQRIRSANTDDWRQYWNDGKDHRPERPKHEHLCRDALLSDLRSELPPAVDAQPEGEYAQDRRADIRVACDDFNVPVEVKKNAHPDLWSAIRNQLIDGYASDPSTGGFGIYLVFWFGADQTQPAPSGRRPATPEDLETRLLETLSEEERRRVSVCVIDVGRP